MKNCPNCGCDDNHDPDECKIKDYCQEEYEEENDDPEYTVWTCGCGTVTSRRQMGSMCPTCGAYMEEEPMF